MKSAPQLEARFCFWRGSHAVFRTGERNENGGGSESGVKRERRRVCCGELGLIHEEIQLSGRNQWALPVIDEALSRPHVNAD